MSRVLKEKPQRKKVDVAKALAQHEKLLRLGLGDRFKGMSEEAVIKALKQTREEIWEEKIAGRS